MDKVIIANRQATVAKYGEPGLKSILEALDRLIDNDRKRHLETRVLFIDDAAATGQLGVEPVAGPTDERGAKAAVDAIADNIKPDYILLLDGPDVVPHINLNVIHGLDDRDQTIESDLPYACASSGFSRQARSYLSITRVVGRLPMARGNRNASDLVALIDRCASHVPQPTGSAMSVFAISADVWRVSTELSLSAVFGSHADLHLSPDACHPQINGALGREIHFINCHGAVADHRFYGQRQDDYPVAMESLQVASNVPPGAVVAAECCYGAMLYDHDMQGIAPPICMSYLLGGALAFVGSTNIAYGPADKNGQADLICQYFLEEVLEGASIGRAMLRARQRFTQTQIMSSPTNLKTLAQFVLYGEPSLHAVRQPPEPDTIAAEADEVLRANDRESSRKLLRVALDSDGRSIGAAATYVTREAGIDGNRKAVERFERLARERGFEGTPKVYSVSGGPSFRAASKLMERTPQLAIIVEPKSADIQTAKFPRYRVLVAHILGDGITTIEECESR